MLLGSVRTSRLDQNVPHDFFTSHMGRKSLEQVYSLQQSCKLPYISYAALYIDSYIATYQSLIKILLGGVRSSRLDQNVPHDFLYIPQVWEICTASVQPAAELQITLYRITQLQGGGKYWGKVHLKGVVRKYLANAILNKTICAYIINNYCFNAPRLECA